MFHSLPFSWSFWNSLRRIGLFFKCLVKFLYEAIWSRPFVCWEVVITASVSSGTICLFRFSDFSWFSFGRLYVSRNLSILSRLPNLMAYSFSSYFLQSFVFLWCQLLFFTFHIWFYLFGFFPFFSWWVWLKVCQSCLSFQRTNSWIHWSFVLFFRLYFIYFCSDFNYFLPSTHFGLCCSF